MKIPEGLLISRDSGTVENYEFVEKLLATKSGEVKPRGRSIDRPLIEVTFKNLATLF
jgi:hypothetical protein